MREDPRYTAVKRSRILAAVFSIVLVAVLCRIFSLQVFGYKYYQDKVINQITAGSALKAPRGNIYDKNGLLLATDKTVYRIAISPVDIATRERKDKKDYGRVIADGIAPLLSLDAEKIYQKTKKTTHMDETLKPKATEEEKNAVLRFVEENGLTGMVRAEATTSRYYPYGSFAAHVIGFTGSDNQGLFGIESSYDSLLTGKDGQYITARDATSKVLENGYSGHTDPIPGMSVTTTIDAYIQRELEHQLERAMMNADAKNRVTGIVMNVNDGSILAMATLPSYDLNAPYTLNEMFQNKLDSSSYDQNSAEYRQYKSELLYEMWNNKAISELYEPGSTFKIVTCAAALDLGVVKTTELFHCPGYYRVGGYNISCHKRGGHGTLTFAEGLQQSCNPVMMQVAERIGSERFYEYYTSFGYLKKTGIDLPSEAVGIFHEKDKLGTTELATASFGQRFKVSPIAQLRAVAAVANGGYLVTPHVFAYATDANGNVTESYEDKEKTRILSEETCKTLREILEKGVSGNGGAKNAYVAGYEIAAKTGTSEKFDILDQNGRSYLRIGSCVAFSPAYNPEIAIILIVDEPSTNNKYGSMTAAPYVSAFMENILPYLGYVPSYLESEETVSVGNYENLTVADAKKALNDAKLEYTVIGNGKQVIKQVPDPGSDLYRAYGKVILYTDGETPENVTVPALIGLTASEAAKVLLDRGLNVAFTGAMNYTVGEGAVVTWQSLPRGTSVKKGTVITITVLHKNDTD